MKILTVVGARPQFIKAAALSEAIKMHGIIKQVLVHTGQHYDDNMSAVFFKELNMPQADYHFNSQSRSHAVMTGAMMAAIEEVILKEQPEKVVVFGDTNSTLAGALAASKLQIPVAHVEAGMRSWDLSMPEEVNRVVTDRVSKQLFCSTKNAVANLQREGFEQLGCELIYCGDIMYDSILQNEKKAVEPLEGIELPYILATIHRAENTNNIERLNKIVTALNELSTQYCVVLPIHPRTRKILTENEIKLNFKTIEPASYINMLRLIKHASIILTDSGGLQKEAYFLKKYCITMRDNTEWTELVDGGYNILAGADTIKIISSISEYINRNFPEQTSLYGNGNAANIICKHLLA